jgi:hypothetical protein
MTRTRRLTAAGIGLAGLAGLAGATGIAGVASATTAPHSHHASTSGAWRGAHHHHALHRAVEVATVEAIANADALPAGYSCTKAATDQARITKAESWLDTKLAKLQTAEQKAQANGKTTLVTVLDSWIQKGTTLRTDLGTVSGLITAQCG